MACDDFTVGAGLPAMKACQPMLTYLTPHNPTVGAGLLAKAVCQSTSMLLSRRLRRQASF